MEAIRLKLGGSGGLLRWMASLVYGNSEVAAEAQHAVKESVITPQVITLDDLVKPPIDAITTDGLPVDAELSDHT
ncbi:hypothetical protein AMS68_002912 [Peltaster fructicola]|uniref:Uncharacterized protein n=1 Tax=Peltaster fructicola TaxID=286661 RepID=A0A6H0XRY4_9PEZI|nr:hypothetical protein AMS68_002912 [Peltaster fructicola]